LLHQEQSKQVVAGNGIYHSSLGRTRLARELFAGRFRPTETVKLREIAVEYDLQSEAVLQTFAELQAIGMVTLSGNGSAIIRTPDPEEMLEAYEVRAAIEEVAGRTAATVLKGYTAELRHQLAGMRAAADDSDLDACAEHDVAFHRAIIKASQNDVLLRTWDTLAVDLRIRAVIGKLSRYLNDVVESHQLILDALESGLGQQAGLLLRSHVERSLAHLTRRGSPSTFGWDHRDERTVHAPAHRGGLGGARLRRVTELVRARIEEELGIEEMAACAGLSVGHFSQMFRQSTGESPHQFLLRMRVERSKEMLRSVEMRILDVAVACGFKTQQHFARVFRGICGVTPTEYRREAF
jgi:DNA-binding GntR family transcriptional regulator/AraC-like DNA-binding protein